MTKTVRSAAHQFNGLQQFNFPGFAFRLEIGTSFRYLRATDARARLVLQLLHKGTLNWIEQNETMTVSTLMGH